MRNLKRGRLDSDDDDDGLELDEESFASWAEPRLRAFLDDKRVEHELITSRADLVLLAQQTEAQGSAGVAKRADSDSVDPLDAFMAANAAEANAAPVSRGHLAPPADEDYDPMAGFAEKQAQARAAAAPLAGYGSDEDRAVYETAAALDAAGEREADAFTAAQADVAPLEAVVFDEDALEPFESNFFRPPPEVARLAGAQLDARLLELQAVSGGREPPPPVSRFAQCGPCLPGAALLMLKKEGFESPTPVQCCALPAALSGRDLLCISQTGSGKTLAFLLPACVHAGAQAPPGPGEGPVVCVLSPTRELGVQIYESAARLGAPWRLAVVPLLGGHDKGAQMGALRAGGKALCVATPGRAVDLARSDALRLGRVTFVVLDEADTLLSLGLEGAVRSLRGAMRPDAQTLLFSATLGHKVASLAASLLTDAVRLRVGAPTGAAPQIEQRVIVLPSPEQRIPWLRAHVGAMIDAGQVLVFASRNAVVEAARSALAGDGVKAASLHGEMDQASRSAALAAFRSGACHVLVATDVASRGLDVAGLRTVVCLEPPRDGDTHTHRTGRTGRAGATGCVAVSLLCPGEAAGARIVAAALEASFAPVPQELAAIAGVKQHKGRGGRGGGGRPALGGRGLGFASPDDAGHARFAAAAPQRAQAARTPAYFNAGFSSAFVPSEEGRMQPQAAQIIPAKAPPRVLPPPPQPLTQLPLPPPAPPPPPLSDAASAARAAAAAIAAKLAARVASAAPPAAATAPLPAQRAPTGAGTYNTMPPPASLGTPVAPFGSVVPANLTPEQAAARAAAEAVAARLFGGGQNK